MLQAQNRSTVLRFAHCCKKQRSGLATRVRRGNGRTDSACLAAFLIRASVFGGPDGRLARACRSNAPRRPGSPTRSGHHPRLAMGVVVVNQTTRRAIMATTTPAGAVAPRFAHLMATAAHQQGACHA